MKTIITHFYNEEYLLPWWLEHHKKIFDMGILIDYGSTDNSIEIIKKICPHWQIFPSAYKYFDAADCDFEIMYYESQLSGFRIALTVTEFIVGNVAKLTTNQNERTQHLLPLVIFAEYSPNRNLTYEKKLWEQCTKGISYKITDLAKMCRSLHNYNDINYPNGRHFIGDYNEEALIFKFSNCLVGKSMIDRRLQIQNKLSERDKHNGYADHHFYKRESGLTYENLPDYFIEKVVPHGIIDCKEIIRNLDKEVNFLNEN